MREGSRPTFPQPDYSLLSVDAGADQHYVGRRCGLGCLVEKNTQVQRLRASLGNQTGASRCRLGCFSPGPSKVHSARRQTAEVDVGLNFLFENLTELLKNHTSKIQIAPAPSPRPISDKPVSIVTWPKI